MRFPKGRSKGPFGTSTDVFQASGNGIFAKKTLQTLQLTIGRHHRLGLQPLNTRRRIALPILAYRNLDLRRPYLTVDHSPAKSTRKDIAVASATSLESTEPEVASTAIPARDRGVVQRLFDAIIAPRSMSFLVSMVVHLAILLILAVFSVSLPGVGNVLSILSGTVDVDGSETPTFEVSAESILDQPVIQEESTMVESEMAIVQPTDSLPSTFDPSTKPKLQIEGSESLRQTDMANAGMFAGAAFQSTKIDSRLGQNRRQVAMARGGTPQSEQAVEDALVWLAAHQFADGGWSLHVDHPDCMGKCQHGTQDLDPKRVAATAWLCSVSSAQATPIKKVLTPNKSARGSTF